MREIETEICIVEDDASTGRALARLLKSSGYSVSVFDNASAFVRSPKLEAVGCVLLDVNLPDINGLEVQRILRDEGHRIPVVFLTGNGDVPMSVRAMQDGAIDFLLKPVDESDLLDAIQRAMAKRRAALETDATRRELAARIASLTDRERQVMACVLTGAMNKQIAAHLGIAEKTVKVHRGRVMQKLGARTIVELIAIANRCDVQADNNLNT